MSCRPCPWAELGHTLSPSSSVLFLVSIVYDVHIIGWAAAVVPCVERFAMPRRSFPAVGILNLSVVSVIGIAFVSLPPFP